MKKLLVVTTLMAFMVAAPLAMAKEEKQINCCIKGKCEQMTKTDCKKAKGKVVKNCKYCK
jgi:hypothetical protein